MGRAKVLPFLLTCAVCLALAPGTIHTIFWTGGTNPFQGRPPGAPHNYIGMVQQYLTDVTACMTSGTY